MAEKPKSDPLGIQRGDYGLGPGSLLLGFGRCISIPIQLWILSRHPLGAWGIPRPPTDGLISLPLVATPQPRLSTIFLGLTATLVIKQNIWIWGYLRERITLPFAFFGVVVPALYEALCALVFTGSSSNPLWWPEFLYVGAAIHFAAAVTELVAEVHRAVFKSKKRNQGKLCTGGAWGVVRHPNFACNVVYGAAYGFAAGGPLFALFTGGFYWSNLTQNATPAKEKYMAERYGEQWERYRKEVPWKMFPGIF